MYLIQQEENKLVSLKVKKNMDPLKSNYKLGIHVPRKDKCISCHKYKNNKKNRTNENLSNFIKHINDKDAVKKLFLGEQATSSFDNHFLVASF